MRTTVLAFTAAIFAVLLSDCTKGQNSAPDDPNNKNVPVILVVPEKSQS